MSSIVSLTIIISLQFVLHYYHFTANFLRVLFWISLEVRHVAWRHRFGGMASALDCTDASIAQPEPAGLCFPTLAPAGRTLDNSAKLTCTISHGPTSFSTRFSIRKCRSRCVRTRRSRLSCHPHSLLYLHNIVTSTLLFP